MTRKARSGPAAEGWGAEASRDRTSLGLVNLFDDFAAGDRTKVVVVGDRAASSCFLVARQGRRRVIEMDNGLTDRM